MKAPAMITIDDIQTYLSDDLLGGRAGRVAVETDLLTSGLVDSLNVMKLVSYLEERGNITIPAQDVVLENFISVEKMHAYLKTRGVAE